MEDAYAPSLAAMAELEAVSYTHLEEYTLLAEGVPTARALVRLGRRHGVELPICETVYAILYENAPAEEAFQKLFFRSTKEEFYI